MKNDFVFWKSIQLWVQKKRNDLWLTNADTAT